MKLIETEVTVTKALTPPTLEMTAVLLVYTRKFQYSRFSTFAEVLNVLSEAEIIQLVNVGIRQRTYRDNLHVLKHSLHDHPSEVMGGEPHNYDDTDGS